MDLAGSKKICPFCNMDIAKTDSFKKGVLQLFSTRGDQDAAVLLGDHYRTGMDGFKKNPSLALYYYLQAAKMGCPEGYKALGDAYGYGVKGILDKDIGRCVRYLEVAAKKGSVGAHERLWQLFDHDGGSSREKAMRHATVLAKAGCSASMKYMFRQYREGRVEKEELTNTLNVHKENMETRDWKKSNVGH